MLTTNKTSIESSHVTSSSTAGGLIPSVVLTDVELATYQQKGKVFDPTQVSGSTMPATEVVDAEGDASATHSKMDAKRAAVLEQPSPGALPDGHRHPLFAQKEETVFTEHEAADLKAKKPLSIQFKQISETEIQLTDPRLPAFVIIGDDAFQREIFQDLNNLLAVPRTREFLNELRTEAERKGTHLQIIDGPESQIDHSRLDTANLMTVEISQSKGRVICKDGNAYVLEPMLSPINLVHELTHGYHMLRGERGEGPDTDGFDNEEERNTIGTVEDVHLQRFTENAYRADFSMNLRVGHYGIQHEGHLTEDETIHALRSSIATGHPFTFLTYGDELLKVAYGVGMNGSEKSIRQGYLRADKEKLLEHAKSNDPRKVQFAVIMLEKLVELTPKGFAQTQLIGKIAEARSHLAALSSEE